MKRKIVDYLPFLGIVLFVCAASWTAGRAPGRAPSGRTAVRR